MLLLLCAGIVSFQRHLNVYLKSIFLFVINTMNSEISRQYVLVTQCHHSEDSDTIGYCDQNNAWKYSIAGLIKMCEEQTEFWCIFLLQIRDDNNVIVTFCRVFRNQHIVREMNRWTEQRRTSVDVHYHWAWTVWLKVIFYLSYFLSKVNCSSSFLHFSRMSLAKGQNSHHPTVSRSVNVQC